MCLESLAFDHRQRRRAAWLLASLMVMLAGLGLRVVHINTSKAPDLLRFAERQQRGHSVIAARRGMILDARGRTVALSRYMPDVFVDPSLVEDVDALAALLGARLNLSAGDIATSIRRRPHSKYVVIARQVDRVTADAVAALDSPAVGLSGREVRTYPLGSSMAQVLGWVGRDGHGLEGIELARDEHLSGRDGRRATIRDARRRMLSRADQPTDAPIDGGHIVLTIDAEIQRITEEALVRGVERVEAESGVAIAMVPHTGEILAMACVPLVDPNLPVTLESMALRRNRAVTDPVEPGSTFKPIIIAGALEGGFVSPTEMIDCHNGAYRFGRRLIKDTRPHGLMDVRGIITKSSNIGMGIIAERMGNQALYDTVRQFGFGRRTGIACPGESPGLVHPLGRWTSFSTTSIPIGYEILVTPLQLISALATIVNDGVFVKPRLIKGLLGPDGQELPSPESSPIGRRVMSADVARFVARDLLVSVVENGGGYRAKVGSYGVLGKTGTAKLTYPDRPGYEPGAYLGLFMGAAPIDPPQVVTLVMIRRPNPKIAYYGGQVAGPVAGEILARTLTYLGVAPTPQVALTGL